MKILFSMMLILLCSCSNWVFAVPNLSAGSNDQVRIESASDLVLDAAPTPISLVTMASEVATLKSDAGATCGAAVVNIASALTLTPQSNVSGTHQTRIATVPVTASGVHLVVLEAPFQAIFNPDVAPVAVTVQAYITTVDNTNTGRLAVFSTKVFTTLEADSGRFILTPVSITRSLSLSSGTTLYFFVEYCAQYGYTGTKENHQTEPACIADPSVHGAQLSGGQVSVTPLATSSCD